MTIQVLPFASRGSAGLLPRSCWRPSPLIPARTWGGWTTLDGSTTERREQVARLSLLYDEVAREALSPDDSAELITRAIQGWT